MIVVSDTTAISNLYQIGIADILKELYEEINISPGVFRELSKVEEQASFLKNESNWIVIKHPVDQYLVSKLLNDLDLGEAESIVLALELKADYLIMDEKLGRKFAAEYGVKITGVLGVLIRAKQKGIIENISRYIEKLQDIGFWLNPKLVKKVLDSLDE
ncbi:MAG: DUF3368 domain-containing protein [Saprospiraceae bacterium]